jgi:CheY-like chemotaxis protein
MEEQKVIGYHIIMADGNLEDHDRVKEAARECRINHIFTSVYNGAQLMALLKQEPPYTSQLHAQPDLLIMDIFLEQVGGFEILEFLKDNPGFKFPIYILSKNKEEEDYARARKLGVREYFQKPLKLEEWLSMVGTMCSETFQPEPKSGKGH